MNKAILICVNFMALSSAIAHREMFFRTDDESPPPPPPVPTQAPSVVSPPKESSQAQVLVLGFAIYGFFQAFLGDPVMRYLRTPSLGKLNALMRGWQIPDGRLLHSVGNTQTELFEWSRYHWMALGSALPRNSQGNTLTMSGQSPLEIINEMSASGGANVDVGMGFFGIGASITASMSAEFGVSGGASGRVYYDRVYKCVAPVARPLHRQHPRSCRI